MPTARDVGSMAVSAIEEKPLPEIMDFPLPQELKDEIYRYLLDGKRVSYIPEFGAATHSEAYNEYFGIAHTYKFSTEIIRVNQTIGAQAAKVFRESNVFVLVNYSTPKKLLTTAFIHGYCVPIVQEHRLETFAQQSFSVDVTWDCQPIEDIGDERIAESMLMLQQDLHKLWEVLRLQCLWTTPSCTHMESDYGERLALAKPLSLSVALSVTVHFSDKAPGANKLQSTFLESIHLIPGSFRAFSALGFPDVAAVARVKSRMTSTLVWPVGVDWERLDQLAQVKHRLDDEVLGQQGNTYNKLWKYSVLLHLVCSAIRLAKAGTPYVLLRELGVDVASTYAWLNLQEGTVKEAMRATKQSIELAGPNAIGNVTVSMQYAHLSLLQVLSDDQLRKTALLEPYIPFAQNLLDANTTDEWFSHDLRLMCEAHEARTNAETPGPGELKTDCEMLSIHAMPPRVFKHSFGPELREGSEFARPVNMVAWQDAAHLARLTVEEKKAIVEYQQANELPITDFD